MSHGFTWGLVLFKDLTKSPIPVRIFIPKSMLKNMNNIYDHVVNNIK
jgi:hypothetical protein